MIIKSNSFYVDFRKTNQKIHFSINNVEYYCNVMSNYFRIKAFEEVLNQDVINMEQLQKLAFNGKYSFINVYTRIKYIVISFISLLAIIK